MSEVYYMTTKHAPQGTVRIRYGGRPSWAFFERCEDGFALLCKPAVLYVTLLQYGQVCKARAIRFRSQHNLNNWVSQNLSGLRAEGYNVHYMD